MRAGRGLARRAAGRRFDRRFDPAVDPGQTTFDHLLAGARPPMPSDGSDRALHGLIAIPSGMVGYWSNRFDHYGMVVKRDTSLTISWWSKRDGHAYLDTFFVLNQRLRCLTAGMAEGIIF